MRPPDTDRGRSNMGCLGCVIMLAALVWILVMCGLIAAAIA